MFDVRLRGAVAALTLATVAVPTTAAADDRLRLGVYGDSPAAVTVWSCQSVMAALRRRISRKLEHETEVTVQLEQDLEKGVADLISGAVDIGRFPHVPSHWVVYPGASARGVEAWREVVVALEIEPFLGDLSIAASRVEMSDDALVARVEDRFGPCGDLDVQRAAAPAALEGPAGSGLRHDWDGPGTLEDALLALIEALPATAAGNLRRKAERTPWRPAER